MIVALRRIRSTAAEIAGVLGMPISTVSVVLRRIGLGKLSRLEPPEPANRYEKQRPGELIHIDVKKLVKIKDGAGHRVTGKRTFQAQGVVVLTRFGRRFSNGQVILALGCFGEGQASLTLEVGGR